MSKTGSAHPDSPPGNPGNNGRASSRRRGLILLALVVVAGVVAWSFYWFLSGRFHESTDDAYVSGDVIAITSREAASVLAVHADKPIWREPCAACGHSLPGLTNSMRRSPQRACSWRRHRKTTDADRRRPKAARLPQKRSITRATP